MEPSGTPPSTPAAPRKAVPLLPLIFAIILAIVLIWQYSGEIFDAGRASAGKSPASTAPALPKR